MPTTRQSYSREDLLRIKNDAPIPSLSRHVRRVLWYLRLITRSERRPKQLPKSERPIKVRITTRPPSRVSEKPTHRFLRDIHRAPRHLHNSDRFLSFGLRPATQHERVLRKIPLHVSPQRKRLHSYQHQASSNLVVPARLPLSRKRRPRRKSQPVPSLFLTNVRSISGKIDEVGLRLRKHQPKIAVFTESWLDASIPDEAVSFADYLTVRKDRGRNGGGIICYIARDFLPLSSAFRVLTASDVPSLADCDSELLPIILPQLLIVAVYHPFWNAPVEHEKCISCIVDLIDFTFTSILDPCSAKLIVCGDFNDLRHYYQEMANLLHAKTLVDFPTRKDSILDQVFTNFRATDSARRLPAIGKSDHASVLWNQQPIVGRPTKTKVRRFAKDNMARFDEAMYTTNWESFINSAESIDEAASALFHELYNSFDTHFPLKTIRMRHNDPPWMKPSLKLLIDRRDRAFTEGKNLKYLRLRQEVIRSTKDLKRRFVTSVSDHRHSAKAWEAIKIIGRLSTNVKAPSKYSADEMNTFFAASFSDRSDPLPQEVPASRNLPSHPLRVSATEVERLLCSTRKKSPGPDGVPYWVLKKYASILSPSVTLLLNWSFEIGRVPACFKEAIISPIPKKPRPTCTADYRPISLLPLLSKITEKFVANHWIKPSIRGRLQSDQFAYVPGPGKGTATALTLLYHKVLSYLDSESGAVRLLSIDFSRAFDKLPHPAIFQAMLTFNFPREATAWIMDFLSNRRQRTRVDASLSSWKDVTSGVPQGSVIGPLLFCMVLDSLSPLCSNTTMIKYADDVTILHFVRNPSDDSLQSEWDHVTSWSTTTGLPINSEKCAVMDFITKKSLRLPPVLTSEDLLPSVTSMRLLGVVISSDMRWQLHVDNVIMKATKRLYILRFLRKSSCPTDIILKAYNALIRPLLLYCYPVFCNLTSGLTDKLVKMDKRALRIAGSAGSIALSSSFLERANSSCENLFGQVEGIPDHPLRECFSSREPTRRNPCLLRPPFARSKRFKDSFLKYCP